MLPWAVKGTVIILRKTVNYTRNVHIVSFQYEKTKLMHFDLASSSQYGHLFIPGKNFKVASYKFPEISSFVSNEKPLFCVDVVARLSQ